MAATCWRPTLALAADSPSFSPLPKRKHAHQGSSSSSHTVRKSVASIEVNGPNIGTKWIKKPNELWVIYFKFRYFRFNEYFSSILNALIWYLSYHVFFLRAPQFEIGNVVVIAFWAPFSFGSCTRLNYFCSRKLVTTCNQFTSLFSLFSLFTSECVYMCMCVCVCDWGSLSFARSSLLLLLAH